MVFRLPILVELKFKKVDFWEKGKTGVPKEKRLRAKEITNKTNSTHIWRGRSNKFFFIFIFVAQNLLVQPNACACCNVALMDSYIFKHRIDFIFLNDAFCVALPKIKVKWVEMQKTVALWATSGQRAVLLNDWRFFYCLIGNGIFPKESGIWENTKLFQFFCPHLKKSLRI